MGQAMLGEPGPGHSIPGGQIHPTGAKNWACPAPLVGPSQPGHISNHLPEIFAGCQQDLVHGRLLQRTFCVFSASLYHSTPPESPGTRLPRYATSPNDLSQLAQASSGDSSLQIPARTGVCQVNLALVMPRQSVFWKTEAADAGVGAGWETKALLESNWSFHVFFKHNSSTKPTPDKRFAIGAEHRNPTPRVKRHPGLASMRQHFSCHSLRA